MIPVTTATVATSAAALPPQLPEAGGVLGAWLVTAGWQAAVLAALVWAVQALLGRRLAPRWRYRLWLLVVLRLALPVLPASPFSAFGLIPDAADRVSSLVETAWDGDRGSSRAEAVAAGHATDAGARVTVRVGDGSPDDDRTPPPVTAPVTPTTTGPAFDWRAALLAVWLAGAVLVGGRVLYLNLALSRRLRQATAADDPALLALVEQCRGAAGLRGAAPPVLVTDAVAGPAVTGLLRPRLLLPPGLTGRLSPEELRLVLLHEMAHLRSRDLLADALISMLGAIHWFNPAAHFAFRRLRIEREMARDATALAAAGPGAAGPYGRTLLKLLEPSRPYRFFLPAAVGILEGRRGLQQRIRMIARFDADRRRGAARFSPLGLALVAVLGCATLTDRKRDGAAVTADTADAAARTPGTDTRTAAADAAVRERLQKDVGQLTYNSTPLGQVLDELSKAAGAPVRVDWQALAAAGIDRNATVTARVRASTLAKALDVILLTVGDGKAEIGFAVEQGAIRVSTRNELEGPPVTRVYEVRDLITVPPDAAPAGDPPPEPDPDALPPGTAARRRKVTADVIELIMDTVDPDSWSKGGATIREHGGQLIVRANEVNQVQIAALLGQLRETRDIQVMIDSRLVAVDEAAVRKLDAGWRQRVRSMWEGNAEFLTDEEVADLLAALGRAGTGEVLASPRVSVLNGRRAYIQIGSDFPYVEDIKVVPGAGGDTRYVPQIEVVNAGTVLDYQATVSADRRYATLTLRPKLSAVAGLENIPWAGGPPDAKLFTQRPRVHNSEIRTTVTVPNQHTLGQGGLVEVGDPLPPVAPEARAGNAGGAGAAPRPGGEAAGRADAAKKPRRVLLLVRPTIVIAGQPQPPYTRPAKAK